MSKDPAALNIDELEAIENKIQVMFDHAIPVLLVDPSPFKSKATIKGLNDAGYFNITVINDSKMLDLHITEEHLYSLVLLDGDIGDNECFKVYLSIKQKVKNVPKTIFLKEQAGSKVCEIYKKGGSLGCLEKPFEVSSLKELLHESSDEQIDKTKIELVKFGEGFLIKLIGLVDIDHLAQAAEHIASVANSEANRCILDLSKLKTVDASFEKLLKTSATSFLAAGKIIEIFDPKNRLAKFNFESTEGIIFV